MMSMLGGGVLYIVQYALSSVVIEESLSIEW